MLSDSSTDSNPIVQQKKKRMDVTLSSHACDNNIIFQPQNARRTSLAVVPQGAQAKTVYFQTSSSLVSQVNRGHGVRMQAVTFENFLTRSILLQMRMGRRSSTETARYARTISHPFISSIEPRQLILRVHRKNGPVFAIVQHNTTLRRHIESAHEVCCQRLQS